MKLVSAGRLRRSLDLSLTMRLAGFFPSIVTYVCFFYKPDERATRLAIFTSSIALAGATSGLIATGVSFLSGKAGLYGWQWLVSARLARHARIRPC